MKTKLEQLKDQLKAEEAKLANLQAKESDLRTKHQLAWIEMHGCELLIASLREQISSGNH